MSKYKEMLQEYQLKKAQDIEDSNYDGHSKLNEDLVESEHQNVEIEEV
jgi:hypothetical protein